MPAHDRLEHCAVVGCLCQANGNRMPVCGAGLYTGMPAGPAPGSSAHGSQRTKPQGREDVPLIISILQVLKGGLGRFATKGVCQSWD